MSILDFSLTNLGLLNAGMHYGNCSSDWEQFWIHILLKDTSESGEDDLEREPIIFWEKLVTQQRLPEPLINPKFELKNAASQFESNRKVAQDV